MTDRDRLIELIEKWYENLEMFPYLADYLLANGVIVPPCKMGDIVHAKYSGTNEIEYYVVDKVSYLGSDCFEFEAHLENEDGYTVDIIEFVATDFGKTVFLTREEAEAKLREYSNGTT